ncbi:MAG: transcriptional regulator [Candidatus Bathyarchaeota archaeon]|nr:MAG: transcriptional regulator [Candidatus Bathyarchaeota archaeon]
MSFEETLKRIEKKLETIENEIREIRHYMIEGNMVDVNTLIPLPDHLRKTAMGLIKVGKGTASDVSRYTKRARAVESGYLNQLERQGFVKSFRRGRRKIFAMESDLRARIEKIGK